MPSTGLAWKSAGLAATNGACALEVELTRLADPPPAGDGVANTSGAKKLGPADAVEPPVLVNPPGMLLVKPPVVPPELLALTFPPPDGINPRTTNGFNAVVVPGAGPPADVSDDVNTIAGDTGTIIESLVSLPGVGTGRCWAATLMPPTASAPTANAAVIGVERELRTRRCRAPLLRPPTIVVLCFDISSSTHSLLDPIARGDDRPPTPIKRPR
jgi:hypothetical protein